MLTENEFKGIRKEIIKYRTVNSLLDKREAILGELDKKYVTHFSGTFRDCSDEAQKAKDIWAVAAYCFFFMQYQTLLQHGAI